MYMGHFGIALGSRAWLNALPLAWLLTASIFPDVVSVAALLGPSQNLVQTASHSLPALFLEALTVAAFTKIVFRSWTMALGASLLVVSHLCVDLLTRHIRLWPGGPIAGFTLYDAPWADFITEGAVILIGLLLYFRSPGLRKKRMGGTIGIAIILIAMQAFWDFFLLSET